MQTLHCDQALLLSRHPVLWTEPSTRRPPRDSARRVLKDCLSPQHATAQAQPPLPPADTLSLPQRVQHSFYTCHFLISPINPREWHGTARLQVGCSTPSPHVKKEHSGWWRPRFLDARGTSRDQTPQHHVSNRRQPRDDTNMSFSGKNF